MNTSELLKQSIDTIQSLKKQLKNSKANEKIAVVGMACRFPGGCDTPEKYWEFLREGKGAVIDIPLDRWDINEYYDAVHGTPGKMYVRKANFLQKDVSEFDAKFFKISPAEANAMDPQQRQLLEVSWEALENAGENPAELAGSKTGVFIGINSSCEYAMLPRDSEKLNQYIGTGTTSSIASGRISYVFGFNGPTLSLDTACSSSLVSTLLAVDALRNGTCDLALSGGVNLMLSPTVMSSLCMMNALSENGKSAPFDASGDGYGRGEGCGILVLKRLSDAQRDKDNIYAVICGGSVNNDGASSGLTVPNGNAQKMVIEDALKNCSYHPDDISYLETHGTGTALGDPIEIKAIQEVFGETKRKEPLILGAVKGNIGHLESAAGVASLIKVVLSLYHKEIVPVSNYEVQNPRINLATIPAVIPQGNRTWNTPDGKARVAGVSSFGFSGTNAHIIVKEAEKTDSNSLKPMENELEILSVSAKDKNVLLNYIENYVNYLESDKVNSLADICYTANTSRAQFIYRTSFIGKTKQELSQTMKKDLEEYHSGTKDIEPITTNPKYAFLFSGDLLKLNENTQYLLERFSKCKEYWTRVIELYKPVYGEEIESQILDRKELDKQELLEHLNCFAIEYALWKLMNDMGISPEVVTGVKTGAYIAAISAGILTLEDAVTLFVYQQNKNENGQNTEKGYEQLGIVLQKPKCRFMSVKQGTVIQNVKCSDIIENVEIDKNNYEDTRTYLYQEGYRYFIEFGALDKLETQWSEDKKLQYFLLFQEEIKVELSKTASDCFAFGTNVNWKAFYEKEEYKKVILPNYPFAKNKYWITPPTEENNDKLYQQISKRGLDGRELILPYKQKQFEYIFTLDNFKELQDNSGVVHLGYYLELLADTMNKLYSDTSYIIDKMEFASPIMVFEQEKKEVLLSYEEIDESKISFVFYSKNVDADKWQKNVYGDLILGHDMQKNENVQNEVISSEQTGHHSKSDFYNCLEGRGFYFGKTVKWVEDVVAYQKGVVVKFRDSDEEDGSIKYALTFHPGIVDSCAQTCNFLAPEQITESKRYMISSLKGISIQTAEPDAKVHAIVSLKNYDENKDELECSLQIINEDEQVLLQIQDVRLKHFDEEKIWKMTNAQGAMSKDGSSLDKNFIMQYSKVAKEEKLDMLTEYVKIILADVLEMRPEEIGSDENIDELGIDSMSGLGFYQALVQALGVELSYVDLIQGGSCRGTAKELLPYLPGGASFKSKKTENKRMAYDQDLSIENWIYEYREKPKAKLRLFCFPYGFGSANMYKEWQDMLGDEIDVCAIKIPGLDIERMKEMAPTDIDNLMETINQVIDEKLLDLPCASFGHSWGSLYAYRMAYRLSQNPKANFVKCFVSGYTSPSLPNTSLYQILGELEKLGYDHIPTDEELKESNSLDQISLAFVSAWGQSVEYEEFAVSGTKLSLPLIVSAYRLIEKYHYNQDEMFPIPIVGFHGIDDYRVSLEDMNAWDTITSNDYKMYTVPGDHGFIDKEQSEERVLELLKQEINDYLK